MFCFSAGGRVVMGDREIGVWRALGEARAEDVIEVEKAED